MFSFSLVKKNNLQSEDDLGATSFSLLALDTEAKCNASSSENVFDIPWQEPFTTISSDELDKISKLTEIERATRIPLGEAMFMKTSEESRFSWNFIKTFIMAALTGLVIET